MKNFAGVLVFAAAFFGANAQELPRADQQFRSDGWDQKQVSKFQLFNDCLPVGILVSVSQNDSSSVKLTEQDASDVAELRLRSAGIYGGKDRPASLGLGNGYLAIRVDTVGDAFAVGLGFQRAVLRTPEIGIAITWRSAALGTYSADKKFILGFLRDLVDKFALDYLRANEEACK